MQERKPSLVVPVFSLVRKTSFPHKELIVIGRAFGVFTFVTGVKDRETRSTTPPRSISGKFVNVMIIFIVEHFGASIDFPIINGLIHPFHQ